MTEIINADLSNPHHTQAILTLLDGYATDPMGGNKPLADFVKENLIAELRKRPTIRPVLAFVDGMPAGLAMCMDGFSTFSCRPLLNIHDLAVATAFRGQGIGRKLIDYVSLLATSLGCCKVTLEVLEGNVIATNLYKSCGFAGYELNPEMGKATFLQKNL
ncbi:N-acetyltransferase [Glaciimonas sp. PCH181]|uniref:GNAT family N-acetyltransferase n=1 Tax=Glaciimonas sp. PCH181 TaxID=2133943 RepID=UPI000D348964|nr:GNAT family N-acetyltransferase [Glaciimonas sp. PCH181]PUA19974.1 GNAT family N-acetyltransferase [Glaciimonas sp. PCH181]